MLQIIAGVILLAIMAPSSSPRRRDDEEDFDDVFLPLQGDRLIAIEESCLPSGVITRSFRTATQPVAWEIQVAASDDGIEHFALKVHPDLKGDFNVTIRPSRKRPIHLERVFDELHGKNLARDGYYANRYRYSHQDEGKVDWFVAKVKILGEQWLFEIPSLHSELIRLRPQLPSPEINALQPTYVHTFDGRKKVEEMSTKVDETAAALAKLHSEIATSGNAKYAYAGSSQALDDLMEQIAHAMTAERAAHAKIDAQTGIDAESKADYHELVRLEGSKNTMKLQHAIQAELDKLRPSRQRNGIQKM